MCEPWIEKYRPKTIDEMVLSDTNKKIIKNMISTNIYPNLLLYGPPGTGKTTTIMCLMNDFCKHHNCKNNYIHLNASHERGVDVIRNQILEFSEKKCIFNDCRKFVLLDEIDSMTKQAQNNLHIIMKKCRNKVTFILICNFMNRIIENLQHSSIILRFNQTTSICDKFISDFSKKENICIPTKILTLIKEKNMHDLRSTINTIQNYKKGDILLDHTEFCNLSDCKKNNKVLGKLLLYHDISTIICFFFNHTCSKYEIDEHTVYMMKLLLTVNKDPAYFIGEFIPHTKKLKLL